MENKKISFGFSKISKKSEIRSSVPKPENKIQLIDCLEGQSIKIKGAVEETNEPLVIPIQGPSNKLIDQIKKAREKHIKPEVKEETGEANSVPDSALSLDELAARELIREAQTRNTVQSETKVYSLPLNDDKFVAEGAQESSLDDYESVPITDFGMAMLRGMNWKEGMPIGKRTKKSEVPKVPELRPKGLGLGANKMVNSSTPSQSVDKEGKALQLVKGAYGKIIAGNHRSQYCQVQGLDDENCRVIVKTALTNEILSLNEFLIVPVTSEEYNKCSRVINNAKYEEHVEKSAKVERDRSRSRSSSREKKHKKKTKKSKSKSRGSDSDNDVRRRRNKKHSRHGSSDSGSDRDYRRRKGKNRR
ncbi:G patch domain and KOW motifs-containing protein-like Protein [Tribolium castaneum]|uniref:G patch domain and KOW motifs-containing protein-like Protein n=1 Tax=Tribolium castaneum TaxID=7070 RepID=D7ELY6_TRICA|nr:PREDICTED: G patch domain and KOW motifs-containing protein isoform X1 [Tribolium castaneum]EFA12465.1 G patch domain and KOW motifs-containing protein-like Protein [Tribolium castaneum]|eukprot:XP_015840310.1 PREDICTED: G patch domain and KOW motifs-containing protein isoform X1 [Tribolium castaneum]